MVVDAIGYAAALLATGAFLPQLTKTVREKSAKDISLGMYVLFCVGVSLWLVYGLLISSWPVIISNVVSLIFSAIILVLKVKHG